MLSLLIFTVVLFSLGSQARYNESASVLGLRFDPVLATGCIRGSVLYDAEWMRDRVLYECLSPILTEGIVDLLVWARSELDDTPPGVVASRIEQVELLNEFLIDHEIEPAAFAETATWRDVFAGSHSVMFDTSMRRMARDMDELMEHVSGRKMSHFERDLHDTVDTLYDRRPKTPVDVAHMANGVRDACLKKKDELRHMRALVLFARLRRSDFEGVGDRVARRVISDVILRHCVYHPEVLAWSTDEMYMYAFSEIAEATHLD